MKSFSPLPIVSALLLASSALAQRTTITLGVEDGVTEWLNGDTVVASLATNINGVTVTQILSTITATGPVLTTPTTALTTPTTTRTTARTTAATTTDENGRPLTTGPRVVGEQETMPPMRATTYGYDNGQDWVTATWFASVTADPTVATYIVPEGTIADYEEYQSRINKQVFASAQAANDNAVRPTGAAGRRAQAPPGGMKAMAGAVIGAIGVGAAIVL